MSAGLLEEAGENEQRQESEEKRREFPITRETACCPTGRANKGSLVAMAGAACRCPVGWKDQPPESLQDVVAVKPLADGHFGVVYVILQGPGNGIGPGPLGHIAAHQKHRY